MKKMLLTLGAFVLACGLVSAQSADPKPFTDAKQVDLLQILPPPPANDSAVTKAELDALVVIQTNRTKEQSDRAVADAVNNPNFTKDKLPKFAAFFDRVVATEPAVVDPAKDTWKRPRPYMADARINPLLRKKTSGAYPSGHTTIGTLMGIVLGDMIPEQKAAIMARAWEFANNRLVAGMHYATDVKAGRLSASPIAAVLGLK